MHFLLLALPLIMALMGAPSLTAPVAALLAVHSLSAAGPIIAGFTLEQKVQAAELLFSVAKDAIKNGKKLHPVHQAILARLKEDIKRHKGGKSSGFQHDIFQGTPCGQCAHMPTWRNHP
jgi:hypothetical protein